MALKSVLGLITEMVMASKKLFSRQRNSSPSSMTVMPLS